MLRHRQQGQAVIEHARRYVTQTFPLLTLDCSLLLSYCGSLQHYDDCNMRVEIALRCAAYFRCRRARG